MSPPQSLLAELRALESKRAQGGLSPPEELRLAELRAVAGHPAAPASGASGFDVNAAAAALREGLAPVPLPMPPAAEIPAAPGAPAIADSPLPPPDETPADWSSWPIPPADAEAPPAEETGSAPAADAGESGWDPAVEAAWEEYARNHGWDAAAPWDAETAAAHWEAFSRSMGWIAEPAAPAAEEPAPAEEQPGPAETARWSASDLETPSAQPPGPGEAPAPVARLGAPAPEADTASWDLGGSGVERGTPSERTGVPDERDPGATAQWSLAPATGEGAPAPRAWSEEPEPVVLEELQPESEGSFGASAPAWAETPAEPSAPPSWPPAVEPATLPPPEPGTPPEPVELGDDQILEVGDDVTEMVEPVEAKGEDLPVVEAVDVAEEEEPPVLAQAAPSPSAPVGLSPPAVEPPAAARPLAPEPPPPEPGAGTPAPEGEPVPLESLTIDEEPLVEEASPPPGRVLPGLHRVVLHTVEGQVMRGVVQDPDLLSDGVGLSPQPGTAPEMIPSARLRAIFFMLAPGEKAPDPTGMKVRVTFRDGRQVAGYSADYDPEALGFFVIPAESRTNTARIWIFRSAVRQVAVT